MRVHLTRSGAISLCEPWVFDKLDVLVDAQPPERLEQAIARIGSRDGEAHVRLAPSVLRFLLSDVGAGEWDAKFDEMISYADSKGWLDTQGRVRAHLTYSEAVAPASEPPEEDRRGRNLPQRRSHHAPGRRNDAKAKRRVVPSTALYPV